MRKTNRATIVIVALITLTTLAGCSILGIGGPTCGPGDTEIGAVTENVSDAHITGELTEINGSTLVINDGTGKAKVLSMSSNIGSEVSTGDCIIGQGQATALENGTHDAILIPTGGLWVEELTISD